ncbi:uncharacterized protein BDZ83DRAFT_595469 [Colletotrichum acutatum]|uniref:Uncharacterized protein n=1 Tax=Glomerella acutata TaxID=27357 RepID=A0AAD8U6F5_GLOAC|nr:uncharacterized protein BDZ83DRAFT_595469 [Colletotrichum acutatum]KAK1702951.1 hypothetical protein BDZ83DRAFT_595469 [Colletotrichum acutatum]
MSPPKIPSEHVYCIQTGKKHHELFTTIYLEANYCGRCGLANPFRSEHRARSRTPALPGPHDEVVEVDDSPPRPVRPVSPASQLFRDKPNPVSLIGFGRPAQLLPNELSISGAVHTRARVQPAEALGDPPFMTVATAASRAIQSTKASTRKPTRQRTGYQWVHISLLLVSLEVRYFNGLAVEVPETVLPLKDTVIKFSSTDLLTWPSFTATLFDHLRPLPSTVDPTNKELWSISYASSFSGKKIVTVPNIDKYPGPSAMLAPGHFGNNQAGQLKVLLVLTSTDVIDKQESVTPLRPEEYPTPVKEEKKRRVKQENTSPAPQRQKRVKHEDKSSSEGISGGTDPNRLVSAGVISSPKVPIYNGCRQDSMGDEREEIMEEIVVSEDVEDFCGLKEPLGQVPLDRMVGHSEARGLVHDGDNADENEDGKTAVTKFVRNQVLSIK